MADSRILQVGDALVELVKTLLPAGIDAEVVRTYYGRRFDAAKTEGLKVYIVARSDVMADRATTGIRDRDPWNYTFSVVVAERVPTTLRTWDDKDAWVDSRVDLTTTIRDRLANPRFGSLIENVPLFPVETGDRETADIDMLVQDGVFVSEFTNTVREV